MRKLMNRLTPFRCDDRGSTVITFGLTLLPMILMVGASIDYANAVRTRQLLQGSTDATALALGQKGMDQDNAALLSQANAFLNAVAMDPNARVVTAQKQTFGGTKTKICVTTETRAYHAIMKIVGFDYVTMHADSCVTSGAASFEIGLVLDTSGSMDNGAGSSTKIAALRTAGKNFVDYMYSSQMNGAQVKIAIAPFSWGVAVDPSFRNASWVDKNGNSPMHWMGYTGQGGLATSRFDLFTWMKAKKSTWDWKGCFESLPYPLNVQDTTPSGTDSSTLLVPSLWPDEPNGGGGYVNNYLDDNGGVCTTSAGSSATAQARVCKYKDPDIYSSYGPNLACSSKPLTRLTNDKTALKTYIDQLDADGNTNIHEGVMWGWRTISPNSMFADGKTYETPDNRKVLVVMTDGMNTWGAVSNTLNKSYYSAYGFFTSVDGTGRNPRLPTQKIDGTALPNPTTGAQGRAAMDDLTRRACQNARNAGVVIYTIGFTTSSDPIDAAGKQLLKDCAGEITRYYEATDAASINTVFGQIAASIGKLRILE
ncbi:MAG: pilus assembly protein [Methylobacteriaceae bacterium]|nr:pilus assembly protein [Methylobacteriaceae bacterium]